MNKNISGQSDVSKGGLLGYCRRGPHAGKWGFDEEMDSAWDQVCRRPLLTAFGLKSCHWPFKKELIGWTEFRSPADVNLDSFTRVRAHTQHFPTFLLIFPLPNLLFGVKSEQAAFLNEE